MASRKWTEVLPPARVQRFQERCCVVYTFLVLLIYAPTTAILLGFFRCKQFGDGSYLLLDTGIRCTSADGTLAPEYARWFPLATIGVAVIVVGLPSLNLAILVRLQRQGKLGTPWARHSFGLLYLRYTETKYAPGHSNVTAVTAVTPGHSNACTRNAHTQIACRSRRPAIYASEPHASAVIGSTRSTCSKSSSSRRRSSSSPKISACSAALGYRTHDSIAPYAT